MRFDIRRRLRRLLVQALAAIGVAAVAFLSLAIIGGEKAVPTAVAQVTDQFLSRRVDQVEQRFYSLESRLNRIEQQQARPAVSPPVFNTADTEISLLRSQIDSMRIRLGEAECALLKLDERTLSASARAARSKAIAAGTDKCRQDPGKAIELSARP